MLRTTIGLLSRWRKTAPGDIRLAELAPLRDGFAAFLADQKYRRASIRSYLNYFRILLSLAKSTGWSESDPAIVTLWDPVRDAAPKKPSLNDIFRFAIARGIAPKNFGELELQAWADSAIGRGVTEGYTRSLRSTFRFFIVRNGFTTRLRDPRRPGGIWYRTPFDELPEPLRTQTSELIRWKLADWAPGRPAKCKHRQVTADELQALICRIFGVATRLKGRSITSLLEVVSYPVITEFASWYINERGNLGGSLNSQMSMLLTSARRFQLFSDVNLSWTSSFLESLPMVDQERQQRRKLEKWVPFDKLKTIPGLLRVERSKADVDPNTSAVLARDELMMKFLTVLPWRQRNLREARIGGGHPNIFKAPAPHIGISRPAWIEDELRLNPDATFWQFHFDGMETKAGRPVSGYLPRVLIRVVEDYLSLRQYLLGQSASETLLVGTTGKPICQERIHAIVRNITRKYVGRAVNPHLCRDIFAIAWLEVHPEDYLTLSKILWHKDVKVTLQRYARNFDESHAARRVDEWYGCA